MTTQTDSPHVTSTATKSKSKTITCGACGCDLELDHPGIQCLQGHHYCTECSTHIVRLVFSEPENYIPLRCLECHIELISSVFERQLTPDQVEIYDCLMLRLAFAQNFLDEDERLDDCPFCTNAVIRNVNASYIFYCDHPECGKVSCLICRKACPKFEDDYATDELIAEMEKHFICAALADDKRELDRYVELGQKVPCPNCGLAGMKDGACTHMTCPKCSQLWCYFCGKKVEDCDRARDSNNGIFDHNHNWERNPKRCPMYLTQIHEVNDRWPEDEFECLAIFHRNRSLRLLREAFEKLGEERIKQVDAHFNTITTCGFTFEEILEEDLTLIKHPDNDQTTL
ncbi:unnamed protein product [Rotaria magnacalcarata]|uniref:RING-type domain-containing protein n=3 Tax=Rotaria magnacalcarata TaxID=392030 RepID=A0A819RU13_9BILA|nr:unnamed protein product [Rotaria magnacalcarata]CAF1486395.1 unnamed protein product [Rotaria magnacalcarata]CAF2075404.1 unnamed protein product [Rotaria magnacalcarata]CAF2095667.1 unnamed protein product [Rotaria magnacalcarata]CAF2132587.1 unnamed protein product [Rotaria magnacalcarata]